MKKAIIPAVILCIVLCIGMGNQSSGKAEPTPLPMSVEATAAPKPEMEIPELKAEEPIVKVVSPTPTLTQAPTSIPTSAPTPTPVTVPPTPQPVQAGDMVYVPVFGWLESQGEGTVIYDEMMYENGNKVGSMG